MRAHLVVAALTVGSCLTGAPAAVADSSAGLRAYFVITAPNATAGAKAAIPGSGGSVYASYDAIGVIVAHSTAPDFATRARTIGGVQQVGATRTSDVPPAAANPAIPSSPPQSSFKQPETPQSDMTQIGADKAWAVNGGSSKVTVAVLDTGIDDEHPDLKPNFDPTKSASCAYGKVDTRPGAWRPVDTHGTHVAGTIAAAQNGTGVVGVAPKVRISAVRVAEAGSTLFFPENTVCAFMFAAEKQVDITNNSYYTDPWLFLCPSDPDQKAILEAVKRSVTYAHNKGVLNIGAAGNDDYDLAAKTVDASSPNDSGAPTRRTVTNDCISVPTELPEVVSVASVNSSGSKSSFSNYGTGKIHVAAPGDNVLSTLPGGRYGPASGTSMASPHVAGVAALLQSVDLKAGPAELKAKLASQANDLECPPSGNECTGTASNNSYFGEGLADAAEAVGAAESTPPRGGALKLDQPDDQLGFGGLPAVPVKITANGGTQDKLTYRAAGLPPGLELNSDGTITGVAETRPGKYVVVVTAKTPTGTTGWTTFKWNIWSF